MPSAAEELFGQARDWFVGHRENDLPRTRYTPDVIGKWMFDEWSLQMELASNRVRWPSFDFRRRVRNELSDAVEMFNDRGWIADPRSYHDDPPPLTMPTITRAGAGCLRFERLSFPSGYEPHEGEPGAERWQNYEANATAHAWLLRHPGPPRPWLICINGYRTGNPLVDMASFDARRLHRDFGLNLAFPVQPLHGPRAQGASGDRAIFGGAMNTVHLAAQGLWDVRRLKSWITDVQEAPAVGVTGLSLGGYLTSLLVCFEADLACAIAGIPESDIVRGMRRNVEPLLPPFYEQWGLSWRSLERANRVVSPLAMQPLLPPEKLFIYAGLVDRWVRPGNVKTLWEQWGRPEICWYQGGHLSFMIEPSVRRFVDRALTSSGLTAN